MPVGVPTENFQEMARGMDPERKAGDMVSAFRWEGKSWEWTICSGENVNVSLRKEY